MLAKRSNSGFKLVEVIIVLAIASVILLAVTVIVQRTNEAYVTVQEDTDANFSLRQALALVSDDMRQSNPAHIIITQGTNFDCVDIQVPVSYASSTVTWGAAATSGYHILYLVDTSNNLVRRIVDGSGVQKQVDKVLARNVDAAYSGAAGFDVSLVSGLYQVTVRVVAMRGSTVWRRTETTCVNTRNL